MTLLSLFLFAVSTGIIQVESQIRGGCDGESTPVATLAAGTRVEIRSALNGESGLCYKVFAEVEGKQISGYVPGKAVKSAEGFDEARKNARSIGSSGASSAASEVQSMASKAAAKAGREHPAAKAWDLINANQPEEALRLIDKELKRYPVDPYLHAVAGMAYYRTDNLERAILHWRESASIEPNASIEALIRRAEGEKRADKGSERMVGNRVILRYERSSITQPFALAMLQALDEEYTRVSFQLGCRATEKVTAVAQSRDSYQKSTQAAEWSGGLYDGRIHVPVVESRQISPQTRQTFAHELVHACLHELGTWPSWLHEGLAQKYSGAVIPAELRASIQVMIKEKKLPKLTQLGNGWGGMTSQNAQLAYALAFHAAEKLLEVNASTGISHILRDPAGFRSVEAELEKRLGL
jgi:tetratricopeptide (TPR) repeat protein